MFADTIGQMLGSAPGTYVLHLELRTPTEIRVGRLGKVRFESHRPSAEGLFENAGRSGLRFPGYDGDLPLTYCRSARFVLHRSMDEGTQQSD